MDQGTNEIQVEGNTIYQLPRSPIRFNEAGKNTFVRNRLAVAEAIPPFTYRLTKAEVQTFTDNEVITTPNWQPPTDDAAVKSAGPQSAK